MIYFLITSGILIGIVLVTTIRLLTSPAHYYLQAVGQQAPPTKEAVRQQYMISNLK
jgi:hypothetical protein